MAVADFSVPTLDDLMGAHGPCFYGRASGTWNVLNTNI